MLEEQAGQEQAKARSNGQLVPLHLLIDRIDDVAFILAGREVLGPGHLHDDPVGGVQAMTPAIADPREAEAQPSRGEDRAIVIHLAGDPWLAVIRHSFGGYLRRRISPPCAAGSD